MFLPTWLVLFGQLVSYYVDYSLAKSLAAGIEGKAEEDMTQVTHAGRVHIFLLPTFLLFPAPDGRTVIVLLAMCS